MGKALSGELSCPCDRSCYYYCTKVSLHTFIFISLTQVAIHSPLQSSLTFSLIFSQFPYLFTDLNLIALRMTKTPQSFGHSECNRVKGDYWKVGGYSKRKRITIPSSLSFSFSLPAVSQSHSIQRNQLAKSLWQQVVNGVFNQ